jgi:uncharacterized protein (TIGR02145 family)
VKKFLLFIWAILGILSAPNIKAQTSSDVKIGTQVWMSKNLDVSTFRNGEVIPQAKNKKQWKYASDNKQSAWCYYEFNKNNGKKYGKLYNWYAVNDARGLAPKGYHIPSDAEWIILVEYLGGDIVAGKKMKSTKGWKLVAEGGNGDNSSGFNGLPGGYCDFDGIFGDIGKDGLWWSSTENDQRYDWGIFLSYRNMIATRNRLPNDHGFSVRCLRD